MAVALEHSATLGEVRVETGTGLIHEVKRVGEARNAQVLIKATHANLRELVSSWADTQDPAVWPVVQAALEGGVEVEYRVEVKRKAGAPLDKPIADLGNREKVRELAAIATKADGLGPSDRIKFVGTATVGQPAATPPQGAQEAPDGDDGPGWVNRAGKEATEQRAAHRQAPPDVTPPASTEDPPGHACELCKVLLESTQALIEHGRGTMHQANLARARQEATQAATASAAQFDPDAAPSSSHRDRSVPTPSRRGPRREEAKPWELYDSDGNLNLASYSYTAVIGFVELAHDLVSNRVADVRADGRDIELKMAQVESLAGVLLDCADKVQANTRLDGRTDRQDMSHTRARGAVRTALKVYPVPWGADLETRQAWAGNLVEQATAITRVALDLFRFHETGERRP